MGPIGTCFIFHRRDAFDEHAEPEVRDSSGKVRESARKCAKDLSEPEATVVARLEEIGSISTAEVVKMNDMSRRGAQMLLNRLIEKGIVEKTGVGRSTRYRLTE